MATTWLPTFMQNMAAWFQNPNVYMYGRWNQPASKNEGGVDLDSPGGTPVYAIADGTIIGAGNFWHSTDLYTPGSGPPGYGVVTTRVNVPGYGLQDLYYQHITLAPGIQTCYANKCTQAVHKGDLLGYVTPGIGEVEMGFNANWGGVWGVNHPGAWATDPRPMLGALLQGGPPANLGGQPTLSTSGLPIGSSSSVDWAGQFRTEGIKIGIFLLALTLTGFGFYLLFQKQADGLIKKGAGLAVKAALV